MRAIAPAISLTVLTSSARDRRGLGVRSRGIAGAGVDGNVLRSDGGCIIAGRSAVAGSVMVGVSVIGFLLFPRPHQIAHILDHVDAPSRRLSLPALSREIRIPAPC